MAIGESERSSSKSRRILLATLVPQSSSHLVMELVSRTRSCCGSITVPSSPTVFMDGPTRSCRSDDKALGLARRRMAPAAWTSLCPARGTALWSCSVHRGAVRGGTLVRAPIHLKSSFPGAVSDRSRLCATTTPPGNERRWLAVLAVGLVGLAPWRPVVAQLVEHPVEVDRPADAEEAGREHPVFVGVP